MEVEIFLNKYYPEPRWCIWYYDNTGYITMHSNIEWKCKEDAEQVALEEMLDGKI